MTIQCSTLAAQKAVKFGASLESQDFTQILIDSFNYVIGDINERLYTTIPLIIGLNESINVDAGTYQAVISYGLDFYISDQGQWTIQLPDNLYERYHDKLKTVQMNHQRGLKLKYKFGDIDSITG